MKCPKDLLGPYLDNRLSPREKLSLEEHISQCPICEGELRELRQLFLWLKPSSKPQPEPDFVSSVMGLLAHEPAPLQLELERRKKLARLLGWGSVMASIIGVILLFALFGSDVFSAITQGMAWLWKQAILMVPNSVTSLSDWLSSWLEGGNALGFAAKSLASNPYLWAAMVITGFFALGMAKEIVDDVQKVIGYRQRS